MYDATYDFLKNMAMDRLTNSDATEYWTGYMRGLRQRYEGKKSFSLDEHSRWLTGSAKGGNRKLSQGYRDGYGCTKHTGDCRTCEYANLGSGCIE